MSLSNEEFARIKGGIQWLINNGYEDKVNVLRKDIASLCKHLKEKCYEDTAPLKPFAKYVCESTINLDRTYFTEFGEHFCRHYDSKSKEDIIAFATEIIAVMTFANLLTIK